MPRSNWPDETRVQKSSLPAAASSQAYPVEPPPPKPDPDPVPLGEERPNMLLREFLVGHDMPCPKCGYNLRDLARPVCPECSERLCLMVARRHIPIGWLVLGLVPGAFSGIAAALLQLMILVMVFSPRGGVPPWPVWVVLLFGWCSGAFAVVMYLQRDRFLLTTPSEQAIRTTIIWTVHLGVLLLIVLAIMLL